MVLTFRLVYASAAFLAMVAGALVTGSLFIADRAPQSTRFLGISLAVSAVLAGVGFVLFGIQRHVAAVATAVRGDDADPSQDLPMHVDRLVVYLLAGGVLVCALLAVLTYAILARLDQGFAVFG
jgi:hypothetical protein